MAKLVSEEQHEQMREDCGDHAGSIFWVWEI